MELPGHFNTTGCFHRAALYDPATRAFIHHTEDIGRHNCLDRLAGWAFDQRLTPSAFALFVTARATASLVTKAVHSGYGVMISRSAVTTGAVALARAAGMTLIGFSRENRFSVFTDPHARIIHE
jgi:FdhD protein